jgi:hypothetical protein
LAKLLIEIGGAAVSIVLSLPEAAGAREVDGPLGAVAGLTLVEEEFGKKDGVEMFEGAD